MKVVDLTGKRYGRLFVKCFSGNKTKQGGRIWTCLCDCGNTAKVASTALVTGNTKSCGCFRTEELRKRFLKYEDKEYASFVYWYKTYQRSAKKREIVFLLSTEEFVELCKRNCAYCNASPEERRHGKGHMTINLSGIDRVDSEQGYFYENCVPCCSWCNFSKGCLSVDGFINHCKKVVERFS